MQNREMLKSACKDGWEIPAESGKTEICMKSKPGNTLKIAKIWNLHEKTAGEYPQNQEMLKSACKERRKIPSKSGKTEICMKSKPGNTLKIAKI